MSELLPLITVIIAARTGQTHLEALSGLRGCRFPRERFEVLLARGHWPSRQRNLAAQEARGEILYFLDDDSVVDSEALNCLSRAFAAMDTVVVGGPNLCPEDARPLQRVFAALMGSWLVSGPSCARYRRVGAERSTSEKELILCNMAVRRSEFERLGGFDESLYPNEENAFLDRLASEGRRLWYDPDLIVYRYPRRTIAAFLLMFFRYGRGRGEQVRRHPSRGSLPNFVPALFVLYLSVLATACAVSEEPAALLRSPAAWPFWLYFAFLGGFLLKVALTQGMLAGVLAAPLMGLAHFVYGAGLWKGLLGLRAAASGRSRAGSGIAVSRVDLGEGGEIG